MNATTVTGFLYIAFAVKTHELLYCDWTTLCCELRPHHNKAIVLILGTRDQKKHALTITKQA